MDTKRWKSILVPRDVYEKIKIMAAEEGRTLGGQLKYIYECYAAKRK